MSISIGSHASWDDIKQIYSNFNSGDGTTEGKWKVTDFGGITKDPPSKPNKIAPDAVTLLNSFVQSIKNNRFVSSILAESVPTPSSGSSLTPSGMQKLQSQVYNINHQCPYDATFYSGYDPNGTFFSGYNPNGTFFSGYDPNGTFFSGYDPNGTFYSGYNPNGTFNSGHFGTNRQGGAYDSGYTKFGTFYSGHFDTNKQGGAYDSGYTKFGTFYSGHTQFSSSHFARSIS